jgi:N-acetylated-alpha-linked acidic dipeptidase
MTRSSNLQMLAAALVAGVALLATAPRAEADILGFSERSARTQHAYEKRFQDGLSAAVIGRASRRLSRRPRLTGTRTLRRAVAYSVRRLRSYGLDVSTPSYRVYASRPREIRVTMTSPSVQRLGNKERAFWWHRHFDEVVVGHNAYSASGDVSGGLVYANRGLPDDYEQLARRGVDVRRRVVLVRYGGAFRGVKVQQAEQRGATGVLLYSDPADDGFRRGPVYPVGPWRPADAIQRGTVEYLFRYPGDPLTPGVASLAGAQRLAPEDAGNLPHIPVAPISYGDARRLLEAPGGPGATEVRLEVDMAYRQTAVRNVLATIRGATEPDEKVIVGGHIDSWTYGAGDNASGWATIMEIGRSLGRLLDQGWRPRRTIVLAGWDGEEHGLLGSTEWVEQFRRDLRRDAVAYLNLSQVGGTRFYASGVPQLDDALIQATKAVTDPRTGRSVHRVWSEYERRVPEVGRLGSGSDYTAFLEHAGVPSMDASFTAPAGLGTYHSAYDDAYNVEHHLDRGYLGHVGSGRVAGVMALRLANADVLPFRYSDYASAVGSYGDELRLRSVRDAAKAWRRVSDDLEVTLERRLETGISRRALARINAALMGEERMLTSRRGLPGRPWFRHQIYAPGVTSGYAVEHLPGLRDALDHGDVATLRTQRDRLLASLRGAARLAGAALTSLSPPSRAGPRRGR